MTGEADLPIALGVKPLLPPQPLADVFPGCRMEAALTDLTALGFLLETGGSQDAAARRLLHEDEQARLLSFSYPKRRAEWLGGRIAAKTAAAWWSGHIPPPAMAVESWPHWLVENAPSGRPRALYFGGSPLPALPHISISHSGGWAAALAASVPCGLDIQRQTSSVLRVAERFAAHDELFRLAALPGLAPLDERGHLTLLWAAKEAIRKAAGTTPLPEFLQLKLREGRSTPAGGVFLGFRQDRGGGLFSVYGWEWGGYGVALAIRG